MGLRWLFEVSLHVGPRDWLWGSAVPAPMQLFGDASEPGESNRSRVCAAVLQRPGHQTLCFRVKVPVSMLECFKTSKKQICVLELLWVVLAAIVWPSLLRDAYVVIYEDNDAAKLGIIRGMSVLLGNQHLARHALGRFRRVALQTLGRAYRIRGQPG